MDGAPKVTCIERPLNVGVTKYHQHAVQNVDFLFFFSPVLNIQEISKVVKQENSCNAPAKLLRN